MKFSLSHILRFSLLALSLVSLNGFAAPAPIEFVPAPPKIKAHGYILLDFHSGRALATSNENQRMEPASLTKLMTAYVIFHELENHHISMDDSVRISEKAWRMAGSRMFVEVGTQVKVEQLLKGLIVQSGNDAAVALAEFVAGSEDAFVAMMNQYAQVLGLKGTHFANATGLPNPDHYSTPHDIARIAVALIRKFPEFYKIYSIKEFTYNKITQHNRNLLLWRDPSVDGMKTGHTESAGYCLVASAKRDDMRLVSVVMGAVSENGRAQESAKLLNWGFRFYESHKLYTAGDSLKKMRVWKGSTEQLDLGLDHTLYVTVPRGQYASLKASLTVDNTITAPVKKGQKLGTVAVKLGDDELARQPLVALANVAQGSLWQRLVDGVMLWFH